MYASAKSGIADSYKIKWIFKEMLQLIIDVAVMEVVEWEKCLYLSSLSTVKEEEGPVKKERYGRGDEKKWEERSAAHNPCIFLSILSCFPEL